MQQVFPCPACGAQNVVGQEFCQSCGQRFQYNCPYCGAIVDATLINCPGCRESLNWPTPQRVRPFPKQPAEYQKRAEGVEEEEKAKPKKKSDPWLTGCLGLVIIVSLALGAYFIYDYFIKEKPSPGSQLPSSSGEEIGFNPMQSPGFDSLRDVITVVYQGDKMQRWL
ncbi:MAG: zinc ribbon domain-containing protein [Chloroflexi bacterium]|nr:zinc ribbon domain-containing protein [Chloroflexota bacterium]